MRLVDVARSVAANAISVNILEGKAGRLIGRPAMVKVWCASSAAGILMTAKLSTNGIVQTAFDDQEVPGTNRYPLPLEDFITEFPVSPGAGGDELIITLRNRTAGALTVTTVVDILPVG